MRLAELLAGLSRVADLGFGLPVGAAARSCVLATRLARALELPDDEVRVAYYTALLHHVGCAGYAWETSRLFGDELRTNRAAGRTDAGSFRDVFTTFLPELTRGLPAAGRARLAAVALTRLAGWGDAFTVTACEVGRDTARRLGLPEPVQDGLRHVYDLWHGHNPAGGLSGDTIPVGSRVARLTGLAVLFTSLGGPELALAQLRRRAGGMLDPDLVEVFAARGADWLAELDGTDVRVAVLGAEPVPVVTAAGLRPVGEVFGDLADLKSPHLLGHARGVAALATAAGERLGLAGAALTDLEAAALLHDVGRVAVPSRVWDKPGPLTEDEWEQVRLHPYHSERILAGSAALAGAAVLAGRHHERLDGSGYHRGCTAADLSPAARVLAAADGYRTLTEPRPHRPALSAEDARSRLLREAARGRLDPDAVGAVLAAAGHPGRAPRRTPPCGLSEREVEVLGLIARGCSNAEVAARLVISRRTAEHHVAHIYTKIGVSGRAAATLFAVEHGLVGLDG